MSRTSRFDDRTTVEVENSRSRWNQKPFRTKAQKIEAQRVAHREHGAFYSSAPVSHHPKPRDHA